MSSQKTNAPFKLPQESQVEITQLMLPNYSNFSGKIFGGHILSLMDEVAFTCASKHSGKYCVTASVDKVDFRCPIEVGELVTMKARVNYVGRSSMVVGIRVEAENIRTGEIKHCNSSYFTMVAIEDGKPALVPGLILQCSDNVRRFLRSAERMRSTRLRRSTYGNKSTENFLKEEFLERLKEYNVKLDLH
ncbi:MAG: acyl-CoA thioesterase [Cytophagales bacterium]|nr:acyl-CoA thioesterase [Cytophagales bacterium]